MPEDQNPQDQIRIHIAKNQIDDAFNLFLKTTTPEAFLNLHNQAVSLYSRHNKVEQDQRLGIFDYDDYLRSKNKINITLLDLINQLPCEFEQEKIADTQPGIQESTLKRHVLRIMVTGKISVLLFLFILWDSGGYTDDQFIGTATLLVPLFTAYTVLMVRDSTKNRFVHLRQGTTEMLVTNRFKRMVYFWLIAYAITIALVLYMKPPGILDYSQMSSLLTLVEIGIGIYVGEIVFALFKKG